MPQETLCWFGWGRQYSDLSVGSMYATVSSRDFSTVIDRCLYLFCMCAVWLYLQSTCVWVQICIFMSRGCYFIKTSRNNIFPATTYTYWEPYVALRRLKNLFALPFIHSLQMVEMDSCQHIIHISSKQPY